MGENDTVEAVLQLLIKDGNLGSTKLEEIFLFEEDSDDELPSHHKITPQHHGKRFHAHTCRHVEVVFKYVDQPPVAHSFRPGATIRKLIKWAKEHFKLDPKEKFDLRLSAEGEPLPLDAHIGTYADRHTCKVTVYLTPTHRING